MNCYGHIGQFLDAVTGNDPMDSREQFQAEGGLEAFDELCYPVEAGGG
jgi:hypothetical protein